MPEVISRRVPKTRSKRACKSELLLRWVSREAFTTFTSKDGASWAATISSFYRNLPSTVYIGLFVSSGTTMPNTATFANVAFTGGSGGLVTTPAAPAALFAAASSQAITVRWLPSFGATAYELLRSTASGSGYAVIASNLSTATTSYVDRSVLAGKTYYYTVRAKNFAGTSGYSPRFGDSLCFLRRWSTLPSAAPRRHPATLKA